MRLRTIFLVEDNQDNADLFCDLLEENYIIRHFRDGYELLQYLGESHRMRPDLFAIDISLPGMDGITLMKKIRSDYIYSDIPMVAVTSHAMADDRRRLLQTGFNSYFSKPLLGANELIESVDDLLSRTAS